MSSDGEKYAGMTMNERLYEAGRLGDFDQAVKNRDRASIVSIYRELAPTADAEAAAEAILSKARTGPLQMVQSWIKRVIGNRD